MDMADPGSIKFEPKIKRRIFHRCPQCGSEWPASVEYCRRCAVWLGPTPKSEDIIWYLPAGIPITGPRSLSNGVYEATVVTVAGCHSVYGARSGFPDLFLKAVSQIMDRKGIVTRGPSGHLAGCFIGKNLIDATERAVEVGLSIQSESPQYTLNTFIGINTGPAMIIADATGMGRSGPKISGQIMDCSEALAFSLQPGMVVASSATFQLAASRFECYGARSVDLWGKYPGGPHTVYVVTGPKKATSWRDRFDNHSVPLVGRNEEMRLLDQYWGEIKSGERPKGLILHLVGEPGIGKSRLLQAFLSRIKPNGSKATLIRLAGSNYGGHPGLLLQEFVTECVKEGISPMKSVPAVAEAGDKSWPTPLPRTLAARVSLVSELLGKLEARGPTLIVIDDIHWADKESIMAFGKAFINLPANMMVIASYRPSGSGLAKLLPPAGSRQIILDPLDEEAAKQISKWHSQQGQRFSKSGWQKVWRKSKGNSLYLEEATKLIWKRKENFRIHSPSVSSRKDFTLPGTNAGLFMARIREWADRELAELRKEVSLRWPESSLRSRLMHIETQVNDWLDRLETEQYLEREELAECFRELEQYQARIIEMCWVGGVPRPLTTRLEEALSRLYGGSYADHYRYLRRCAGSPENHLWVGNQARQAAKRARLKGRLQDALPFYRLAEKVLPSDDPFQKDLFENAGDVNLMLGLPGEAVRLYEKALGRYTPKDAHDPISHKLFAARVLNGERVNFTSFQWKNGGKKESCPWHHMLVGLGALLSGENEAAAFQAEEGKRISSDWLSWAGAGLTAALAQLATGNVGNAFSVCAEVAQGMHEGGLSLFSLGLHWVLSQATEGPSRSRHLRTCRFIAKQLGIKPQAFLSKFDFDKGDHERFARLSR
jgi:tetratricopeptide (TPR) repeat protein